jgi:Flp pilus assembly protein TadG
MNELLREYHGNEALTGDKVTYGTHPHKLLYRGETRSRGQELVEFAIIVPFLILVVIGVLDLGRAFFSAITIANAAREGARYAISYGLTYDLATDQFIPKPQIKDEVLREAANSGIVLDKNRINVQCPTGCGPGKNILVTVEYDFHLVFDAILPDFTITRHAEMMVP